MAFGYNPIRDRVRLAMAYGWRFALVRTTAAVLSPNFKMRYPAEWMTDEKFAHYLQVAGCTGFKSVNAGRHWMLSQLLRLTADGRVRRISRSKFLLDRIIDRTCREDSSSV